MPLPVNQFPSPNHTKGRKGYKPEAVVIHIMEGTLAGTDSWFKNPQSQVSAHYGIGRSGEIHQYVDESDCAWHAGRVSTPSWTLIKKSATGKFINPNYYTIGIEHEGNENSEWTDAMYQSSGNLIKEICFRHNIPLDRQHIIGHHEIYAVKTCPGFKVSFTRLIEIAKGNTTPPVPTAPAAGNLITTANLRVRSGAANTTAPVSRLAAAGTILTYSGQVKGEKVNGIDDWYTDGNNHFWWAGGVEKHV